MSPCRWVANNAGIVWLDGQKRWTVGHLTIGGLAAWCKEEPDYLDTFIVRTFSFFLFLGPQFHRSSSSVCVPIAYIHVDLLSCIHSQYFPQYVFFISPHHMPMPVHSSLPDLLGSLPHSHCSFLVLSLRVTPPIRRSHFKPYILPKTMWPYLLLYCLHCHYNVHFCVSTSLLALLFTIIFPRASCIDNASVYFL